MPGELLRHLLGGLRQAGPRDNLAHQPRLLGRACIHGFAEQQAHREWPGTALGQASRRNRRKGGERDFGEGEDRVVGRDDDIAQQRDLGAAAERRTLDRRDGDRPQIEQEPGIFAHFRQHRIGPGGDVVRNVDAG